MWHFKGIFVSGPHLAIMYGVAVVDCCFFDLCVVMCDLYVDYSSSAVGHVCVMWGTFVQGHMPII